MPRPRLPRSTLALTLLLVGCGPLAPVPTERPTETPSETRVLGRAQVMLGLDEVGQSPLSSQASALPEGTLRYTLESFVQATRAGTPSTRYLQATFAVQNTSATQTYQNLSLLAYVDRSSPNSTVGGTGFYRLLNSSGQPVGDASVAQKLKPTHGMRYSDFSVEASQADFGIFDDAEAAEAQTKGQAVGVLTSQDRVLPYGFIVRKPIASSGVFDGSKDSRTLLPGETGKVTLAFKMPQQPDGDLKKPVRFGFGFVVTEGGPLRVTRSVEEGSSTTAAQARAANFAAAEGITTPSSVQVAVLGGDAFTAPVGSYTRKGIPNRPISLDSTSVLDCDDVRGSSTACNLTLSSGSYAGLGTADQLTGADLESVGANAGTLVLGGTVTNQNFGVTPTTLLGGGVGAVLRLSGDGKTVLGVTRLGSVVSDLELNRSNDDIAVAGNFGVAVLSAGGGSLRWSTPSSAGYGPAQRVSIGRDGKVVGLFGKTARLFDASGTLVRTVALGDSIVNDVSINSGYGNSPELFYITGNAQRDGSGCSRLRVAWIRAYTFSSTSDQTPAWKAYDYPLGVADAQSLCADTIGARVAMGRDNKLYFAGYSAGGNSIFSKQSVQATPVLDAPNARPDKYQDPFNTRDNNISYVARLDPSSGSVLQGSFVLARLGTDADGSPRGNTIQPYAISADENGVVYLAGASAYQISRRDTLTLGGYTLPRYRGGDGFVLSLSSNMQTRKTWMVFNDNSQGLMNAVAASSTRVVLAGYGNTGTHEGENLPIRMFVTPGAPQTSPPSTATTGSLIGGYFASWTP